MHDESPEPSSNWLKTSALYSLWVSKPHAIYDEVNLVHISRFEVSVLSLAASKSALALNPTEITNQKLESDVNKMKWMSCLWHDNYEMSEEKVTFIEREDD